MFKLNNLGTPTITVGGNAVIRNNTRGGNVVANVGLTDNRYLALSTTTPPTTGMNIGITKPDNGGVFVQSGAAAVHVPFFFSDNSALRVVLSGGQLSVVP